MGGAGSSGSRRRVARGKGLSLSLGTLVVRRVVGLTIMTNISSSIASSSTCLVSARLEGVYDDDESANSLVSLRSEAGFHSSSAASLTWRDLLGRCFPRFTGPPVVGVGEGGSAEGQLFVMTFLS